jgi:hypothetical protein
VQVGAVCAQSPPIWLGGASGNHCHHCGLTVLPSLYEGVNFTVSPWCTADRLALSINLLSRTLIWRR